MTSKITPGPWRLSNPNDTCYVSGPNGEFILKRDSRKTWDKEAASRIVADCRLIASAPDLLAIVQEINDTLYIDDYGNWCLASNFDAHQLDEVIAKATGVKP